MGVPAQVSIEEITQPDLDARLVADGIASQLERRVMFRRAMKRAVQNSMKAGAQGIKVELSGRLGGAERLLAQSGIVKVVYLCIHYVLTLTTQMYAQKPLTVLSV
ncbi:30S ribosomal protein S3 [Glycine soja]|uniref:30S ribosomal protein S3 n=1 Tax=Glycine soja TaxID=3848 RepID=A0A0B2S3T0_GLYSO|nr:30S ribosomal protein S3 [Glycine soja]